VSADPAVTGQQSYVIDRGEQVHSPEAARSLAAQQPQLVPAVEEDVVDTGDKPTEEAEFDSAESGGEHRPEGAERDGGRRRRRRRGRGGRGRGGAEPREGVQTFTRETVPEHAVTHEDHDAGSPEEEGFGPSQPRQEAAPLGEGESREGRRRRRRGRRGGRRNRQRNGEAPFRSGEKGGEPELQRAIEDQQPNYEGVPAYSAAIEDRPPQPVLDPVVPAAGSQDPLRRRSTIREPAPFGDSAPTSPSAPSSNVAPPA